MKNYHFLPVFLTLLVSYIGLHIYSASWFSRCFGLSAPAAYGLRLVFLLLALFSPLTMFMRHRFNNPALDWFYAAGYSWMGIIFIGGMGFLFADLIKLGLKHFLSPAGLQYYRYAVIAALGIVLPYAFYSGAKDPAVKALRIAVPNLPAAMEGIRIAQISDIHLDSGYKLRQFSDTVDAVAAANPDLVLFTGDLVDPGLTEAGVERVGELIHKLKPRLGVYGVLGNHEYYFGYAKSVACYKKFGITLLLNEAADAALTPGKGGASPALLAQNTKITGSTDADRPQDRSQKGGASIRIIGLSDILTEKMTENDVKGLLQKYRRPEVSILMTHQPVMYPLIAESGDFVVFSGHTHEGQIFPFHIFTRMFYKYFYGLYHIGNSVFYVTSGTGTWGPPMRWLASSEIPVITLTAQSK